VEKKSLKYFSGQGEKGIQHLKKTLGLF